MSMVEKDEAKRQQMLKEMTRDIVDKAPYIWLPVSLRATRRGGPG